MIEIDGEGNTIPSVVSFVPTSEDEQPSGGGSLLPPPWSDDSDSDRAAARWPDFDGAGCRVYVGRAAMRRERDRPESSYRNVKRVVGTGGRMATLAAGVVPNLFVGSADGGSVGGSDELFGASEESDVRSEDGTGKKKKKKQKKGKGKSRWQKKRERELPKLRKQLEEARGDPALLTCRTGGADGAEELLLRPEQISACVLRKLYDEAERHHRRTRRPPSPSLSSDGEVVEVTRAVIGVPAYFTEAQREATIRASELAGVSKVKLLPEPEAAALAYGAADAAADGDGRGGGGGGDDDDEGELILVFDLGGGTFDVSVLEAGGGVTEVLATVGNNRLGGTDFDRRVAEHLSGKAAERGGRSPGGGGAERANGEGPREGPGDAAAGGGGGRKGRRRPTVRDWYRHGSGEVPDVILRVAEEARKRLSNQKSVEVLVPLTEEGWRRVGGGDAANDGGGRNDSLDAVIGPIDKARLESEHDMVEEEDYTVVTLDRRTFETICADELQMLLQPLREVAIMAGVLLPGEARPSFVENALAMARAQEMGSEGGEAFWDFEDEEGSLGEGDHDISRDEEGALDEQALRQIEAMDIKAQKKAQQRGRRMARDIDKRERSFRKQKRSAAEEAATASLLRKRPGGGRNRDGVPVSPTPQPSGNERVREGIHGRPLSRIVLVGGATRMPVVGKLLEAVAGIVPQRTVHPDEAVALGCAVQAGILDGENAGLAGGTQAVLSPMQAAVMRALAKKRGMDLMAQGGDDEEMEVAMMGGVSGMMVVDEFDDEDDFY
ncbi:hypothetical protein ACHAWF_004996 [Thalassiosira exigua]